MADEHNMPGWHLDWVHVTLDPGALGDSSDDVINVSFRIYLSQIPTGAHLQASMQIRLLDEAPGDWDSHLCDGSPRVNDYPAVIVTSFSCSDDQPDASNPAAPCNVFADKGYDRCWAQQELGGMVGLVLNWPLYGPEEVTGLDCKLSCSFFTRDVFHMAGGFKLNDEAILMLIPGAQGCKGSPDCDVEATCDVVEDANYPGCLVDDSIRIQVATIRPAEDLIDLPRWLKEQLDYLTDDLNVDLLGAAVRCEHGYGDCAALGGDQDEDGLCDAVDLCPDRFSSDNFDDDGDGVGDGMGQDCTESPFVLDLPGDATAFVRGYSGNLTSCRSECDNCPDKPNPGQENTDKDFSSAAADELGDACDPDIDGDGIPDERDCQPYHDQLRWDIDHDGRCDHIGPLQLDHSYSLDPAYIAACQQRCTELIAYHGVGGPVDTSCYSQCVVDNCSPFMYWGPAYPNGHWTNPQEDDLHCGMLWTHPNSSFELCSRQYGNPDQEDSDWNGVGDKCEFGAKALDFGPSVETVSESHGSDYKFECRRYGESAYIDFRTWGGNAGPLPAVAWEPELRTGVEIGACKCDVGDNTGHMDNFGCRYQNCPLGNDRNLSGDYAWNPIASDGLNRTHPVLVCSSLGNCSWVNEHDYPVHSQLNLDNPVRYQNVKTLGIAYARELSFTRNGDVNRHSFGWNYKAAPELDQWTTMIDYSADAVAGEFRRVQPDSDPV